MGTSPKGHTYNDVGDGLPLLNGPTEFGDSHPECSAYTTASVKECEPGDLIFCVRGSTTGRMNWADKIYSLGRGVCAIRGETEVDTKFIRYGLEYRLPALLQLAGGATFPNLPQDTIKDFRIPFPSNRKGIASVLSAYDDLIENNRRRMALLEEGARQLYREWFVRLRFPGHEHTCITRGVPDGWRKETIGDYMSRGLVDLQTGPFGTQLRASDYTEVGTPVINVRNIGYGDLRSGRLERVPDRVLERHGVHILRNNDIVFGRKGAVDRHLLVRPAQEGWMQGSDCIRLRVLSDALCPLFVSFGSREETHKEWMLTQCSNKATMASLNQEVIARIPLRTPVPSLVREFRSFASDVLRQSDALERQSQRAARARDLLLPRLMSGESAV